ncbi:acyl-CoA N-acyltransferase [Rickenella mellea]|uniref:Acyl-CoA N-acyltransferase n=1 Tax=Rickenella mellea TaxID=50990 RepID=A0A4Y7PZX2_9AGAM|nr:acyl-CoA N-acyltransferase [Rickenella mellea]
MERKGENHTRTEGPYDVNFCFPSRTISNDRLQLTPFIPSVHAETYFAETKQHPELYHYLPFQPFESVEVFNEWFEHIIHRDPQWILFAVFDKSNQGAAHERTGEVRESSANTSNQMDHRFAGVIGLLNTSVANLSTEIGFVFTLPAFQRTHVTSNAVGLLLQYCLELPPFGLGLRRVQWQANAENKASIRAAERMGFEMEGIQRWQRILPHGKFGKEVIGREGEGCQEGLRGPGRDTAMLSMCWDDWIDEKEKVCRMMAREN